MLTRSARKALLRSAFGVMVFGGVLIAAAPGGAEPIPYGALPVDPNLITDSTAYVAQVPVPNPDGQPGVQQSFTHRDGSREITDTVWVLEDAQAAAGALQNARSQLGQMITEQNAEPAAAGENGTIVSGPSPDGSRWVSVLLFTRGSAAVETQFDGTRADPAPTDLIVEYGQRHDEAIRQQLSQ